MKVKDGFGNPNSLDRLQSLQSHSTSLKELKNVLNFDLRYKNGWDWKDWSAKVLIGELQDPEFQRGTFHELFSEFQVSVQCQSPWRARFNPWPMAGLICICGHPNRDHFDGEKCQAGNQICNCLNPSTALSVSDVRYFYRVTKGPHEAHALVLGLDSLNLSGGDSRREIPWVCDLLGCSQSNGVNPVLMRENFTIAMSPSVYDKNKLMCEPCLFRELNGK